MKKKGGHKITIVSHSQTFFLAANITCIPLWLFLVKNKSSFFLNNEKVTGISDFSCSRLWSTADCREMKSPKTSQVNHDRTFLNLYILIYPHKTLNCAVEASEVSVFLCLVEIRGINGDTRLLCFASNANLTPTHLSFPCLRITTTLTMFDILWSLVVSETCRHLYRWLMGSLSAPHRK